MIYSKDIKMELKTKCMMFKISDISTLTCYKISCSFIKNIKNISTTN